MNGAIFLYDNAAQRGTFVDDGRLDVPENIISDQLAPPATFTNHTVMEWQWGQAEQIDAVALWGTSQARISFGPIITVERWDSGAWHHVPGSLVVSEPSLFQPAHLIFLVDERVETTKLRVTPMISNNDLSVGSVQLAKALQDPSISDEGWSQTPFSTAVKDASQGGQQFASPGSVGRRFTINQARGIELEAMFGRPKLDTVPIALQPPILNNVTESGDWLELNAGSSVGFIEFPDTGMVFGGHYLLVAEVRIDGLGSSALFPTASISSADAGDAGVGHGRHAAHFTTNNSNLVLQLSRGGGPASIAIRVIDLWRAHSAPVTSDGRRSMLDLIAISGSSRPVGVILRPDDPITVSDTTIYGVIDSFQPYTDLSGNLTGGGFTIVESLG